MKLIDYIKSPRRGADANAIEREAMCDPFLTDAIDGYDAVYGNHSDKLSEIESKLESRYSRRRKVVKNKDKITPMSVPCAASAEMSQDKTEEYAADLFDVSEEYEYTEIRSANTAKVDLKSKNNLKAADTEKVKGVVSNPYDDYGETGDYSGNSVTARTRRWMLWSAAALFVVASAGVWMYLSVNSHRHLEGALAVAEQISLQQVFDTDEFTENPIAGANAEPLPGAGNNSVPDAAPVDNTPVVKEDFIKINDNALLEYLNEQKSVRQRSVNDESAKVADKNSDISASSAHQTQTAPTAKQMTEETPDNKLIAEQQAMVVLGQDSVSKEVIAGSQSEFKRSYSFDGSSSVETEPASNYVVNQEFNSFFEANSRIHTDSFGEKITGEVIVEFRVNNKGVPSAVKIVQGISVETNSEIIDLLIKGPRWEPTNGKLIRTSVRYK